MFLKKSDSSVVSLQVGEGEVVTVVVGGTYVCVDFTAHPYS